MAKLVAPFDITGDFPIDRRLVFDTVDEMNAFDTAHLPSAYFAVCVETPGVIWVYNKNKGGWTKCTEFPEYPEYKEDVAYKAEIVADPDTGEYKPVWVTDDTESNVNVDKVWIDFNDKKEISLTVSAKNVWNNFDEHYNAWKDTPVPPSAINNKYYGIKNNVWQELVYESYKLSDTVISAINPETNETELQSVVSLTLDDGLLKFNNGKLI